MGKKPTNRADKNRQRQEKKSRLTPSAERYRQRQMLMADFPEIIYQNESSPDYLLDEVKAIIDRLKTSDEVPRDLRTELRSIRADGYQPSAMPLQDDALVRLGELIYRHLMQKFRSVIQWSDDVAIEPNPNDLKKLRIKCRSLERMNTTTFFSPKRPTVTIDGKSYQVVYELHTMVRIAERLVSDKTSYKEWGTVFSIPYRTRYFEVVKSNDQTLIKLWNFCDPSTTRGWTHHDLLGPNARSGTVNHFPLTIVEGHIAYYLLGYCPVRIDGERGLAVLTTLLLPGMENTPEYHMYIQENRPSTVEKMDFGKRINATSLPAFLKAPDFETIRLLHSYVPQVKAISEPVFDYNGFPSNETIRRRFVEHGFGNPVDSRTEVRELKTNTL